MREGEEGDKDMKVYITNEETSNWIFSGQYASVVK